MYENLEVRLASQARVFGTTEAFSLIAEAERDRVNLGASSATVPSQLKASQRRYLQLGPEERAKVDALRAAVAAQRSSLPARNAIGHIMPGSSYSRPSYGHYGSFGVASSSRAGPSNANRAEMVRISVEALKRKLNIVRSIESLSGELRRNLYVAFSRQQKLALIDQTIAMINGLHSPEFAELISQRIDSLRQLRDIIENTPDVRVFSSSADDISAATDSVMGDIEAQIGALSSQAASEIAVAEQAAANVIRNARSTSSTSIAGLCEAGDYKSALQKVPREWKKVSALPVEYIAEIFKPYIKIAGPEYADINEDDRQDSLILETINPGDKLFVYPCTHGRQVNFEATKGHTFLLEGFIAYIKTGVSNWTNCPLCRGAFTIEYSDMLKFNA